MGSEIKSLHFSICVVDAWKLFIGCKRKEGKGIDQRLFYEILSTEFIDNHYSQIVWRGIATVSQEEPSSITGSSSCSSKPHLTPTHSTKLIKRPAPMHDIEVSAHQRYKQCKKFKST